MLAKLATRTIEIVPTIDTSIYASGDQLGPTSTELPFAVWGAAGLGWLIGINVLDKDKESSAMDLVFFNALPTVASTDNAAFDCIDSEMASKWAGVYSIAAADYKTISGSTFATYQNFSMPIRAKQNTANPKATSLWMSIVCRGTPTYTTSTDLKFVLTFAQ